MKKRLLLLLILVFVFITSYTAIAHSEMATPSLFFCVGDNPQPPCATVAPSQQPSTSASISPTVFQSPSTIVSTQPSTILSPTQITSPSPASPCGAQAMNTAMHVKKHHAMKNGLLRLFFKFLLELLQLLFQLLGIQIPQPPHPHPTPTPVPSSVPSSVPSPTTNPCPSTSPTQTPSSNPSPSSVNCQPNAILVNPCRPWIGAAAIGNPGAAKDRISQFTYLEKLSGRQLDVYHDYNSHGAFPLNSDEKYFALRPNTYIYINWKPANTWADADGSNASVNAIIDNAAASIKAIAPHKIFLTIWHEPENDVSPGTSSCPNLQGTAGSPDQYKAMWQNVRNRFNAAGVTNVVWVMNYMGYFAYDCLIPQMWPGNNLVDWVSFESYGTDKNTSWATSGGRIYNVLKADQSSTTDFFSKPWAIAEFGTCKITNEQTSYQYFQSLKAMLDSNLFSNIKMYMIYADTGNNAGPGCLTNFSITGVQDNTKQTYYNQFVNDPIFTNH